MQNNFNISIFVLKYKLVMKKYNYCKVLLLLLFSVLVAGEPAAFASGTSNKKPMVVVIDPGHGGKDPGAVNKSIREKDIVLGIGLKLGKYINEQFPDVKVVYTRSNDVFVPLIERSKIANKNKADLFISLHANHCGTPPTRGTETFVLGLHRSNDNLEVAKKENSVILLEENYEATYEGFDPNQSESYIMFELVQDVYMDQSVFFADAIQNQFKTRLASPNRGVKQAGFLVLRQSSMPSVLVEAGFLSNQAEANFLNSEEGQRTIALSLLEAFRKFKGKNTVAAMEPMAESKQPNSGQAVSVAKEATPETKAVKAEVKRELPPVEKKDTKPEIVKPEEISKGNMQSQNNNTYFSIQVGANTTPVEPAAHNFKGLKEVRREKMDKYYRYYVGKEPSLEKIAPLLQQVKTKFPQAFVVSFIDGNRVVVNPDGRK